MPVHRRETRIHQSILAGAERRLLVWIAARLPAAVTSDRLTLLGGAATLAAGLGYAVAPAWPPALILAIVALGLNWFGDSLDGTVARVRGHERPRYGFYVDHVLDAVGMLFVLGGLLAGGFVSLVPAAAFLAAYYLLLIEIALATHALGTFRISFWKFGPTELRILLAVGTLQLLRSPSAAIGGSEVLLFDAGAAVGAAALFITFVISAVTNTRTLYRLEPLPQPRSATNRHDPPPDDVEHGLEPGAVPARYRRIR